MQFWAYRHVDGGIHVRAYRADGSKTQDAINDAFESDFVDDVLDPFEAENREQAEQIAKQKLDNIKTAS